MYPLNKSSLTSRCWPLSSSKNPRPALATRPAGLGCSAAHGAGRGLGHTSAISLRSDPPSCSFLQPGSIKQAPLFCTELTSC